MADFLPVFYLIQLVLFSPFFLSQNQNCVKYNRCPRSVFSCVYFLSLHFFFFIKEISYNISQRFPRLKCVWLCRIYPWHTLCFFLLLIFHSFWRDHCNFLVAWTFKTCLFSAWKISQRFKCCTIWPLDLIFIFSGRGTPVHRSLSSWESTSTTPGRTAPLLKKTPSFRLWAPY